MAGIVLPDGCRKPNAFERFSLKYASNAWDILIYRIPPKCGMPCRANQSINLHKGLIFPVCLGLMLYSGDFSTLSWIYAILHGFYGFAWIMKDITFGDPTWRRDQSPLSFAFVYLALCFLVFPPALVLWTDLGSIVPGRWGTTKDVHPVTIPLALAIYITGFYFHYVSDAQKYYTLKYRRESGIITDGPFQISRNPNYLGEVLLYASFCVCSQHWLPFATCMVPWLTLFLPNMIHKDLRMSRHPGYKEYASRTGMFFPYPVGVIMVTLSYLSSSRNKTEDSANVDAVTAQSESYEGVESL